jgi:hypothetical protein
MSSQLKFMNTTKQIAVLTLFALMHLANAEPKATQPQDKLGYNKTKDAGAKAPKGADILFDGTQKSIDSNWEMWPKSDMKITWSLVKSPTSNTSYLTLCLSVCARARARARVGASILLPELLTAAVGRR